MSGLNKETSGNLGRQASGSLSKGLGKVKVSLMWDPSPLGMPDHDLDIIAGTYSAEDPHGRPAYLVHFDQRLSPDGTINLNRDSRTGAGFGADEVMTLELDRLSSSYARVVVGVAIQQNGGHKTFGTCRTPGCRSWRDTPSWSRTTSPASPGPRRQRWWSSCATAGACGSAAAPSGGSTRIRRRSPR